jgi:DNA mismatch repair protein MutL
VGCNFKVDNLFFNVPARRKFLKSNSTELNNILTAFERIVLVYPQIHFTLHHNGVEMLNLRAGSVRQRIADVFGKQYSQDLLPVEVHTAMCTVTGFVGKPEAARKKTGCDYFFVNGRFMKHAYFHKAVMKAYDRLVPEGMAIPYFLYIEVEPSEIDVNIHPTKTEIKFENEQAIWQILSAAVRDGIGKFCEVPSIDFDTQGQPEIPLFDNNSFQDNFTAPKVNYNPDYNPFKQSGSHSSGSAPSQWESLYEGVEQRGTTIEMPLEQPSFFDDDNIVEPQSANEMISEKSPAHYQYKGKYLMTAVKSGLMIIDQHRASIRILYDKYMSQQDGRVITTQKLLFPETVQFSPSEAVSLLQLMPELTKLGFDLSDLGGNTFAVNGIPSGIDGIDPKSLLHEMIDDTNSCQLSTVNSQLSLRLAQSAAIPYGQILSNDEMECIINDLFACTNVNYTPDGKAILCILPQGDIEHLLG